MVAMTICDYLIVGSADRTFDIKYRKKGI